MHGIDETVLLNCEQAVWIFVWERPEEHSADQRENCNVGADADSQRKYRDGGEPGVALHPAKRIPHILLKRVEHRKAALITATLLGRLDTSKLEPRLPPGI